METLPNEIIIIILNELAITDKRSFIKCGSRTHKFYPLMGNYEKDFIDTINKTKYLGTKINKLSELEKYTLEIIYDEYTDTLPYKYIKADNKILWNYGNIYFNMATKGSFQILFMLTTLKKNYVADIINGLAYGGHLDTLKIFMANGYDDDRTDEICKYAVKNGHLEILKWARENNYYWGSKTCTNAAKNGHLEILKWMRENGCNWNSLTCANAAKNGHLDILKWARENGCEWNSSTCDYAAKSGHLDILKWARENGCDWDYLTCAYAAKNGHFEILKWARENGCGWDNLTCAYAAKNGHFEILKWARKNWLQKPMMLLQKNYLGNMQEKILVIIRSRSC